MHKNDSSVNRKEHIQWMWESNSSAIPQYTLYTEIENEIIEEAYQKDECFVSIDFYHIDLKRLLQISKENPNHQYPIKRSVRNIEEKQKIRLNRFQSNNSIILTTERAFIDTNYKYNFILEVSNHFKLHGWRTDNSILPGIVEKAVEGLIVEGKLLKKETEAEWMTQKLGQVTNSSAEDIWNCCAYLYTRDSFLYREINKTMRYSAGEGNDKDAIWYSKIPTIGPFTWLLSELRKINYVDTNINVYRGLSLSDNLIEQFRSVEKNVLCCFPAFTSATADPAVAEMYAENVICHLSITVDDGIDVSTLSQFQDEMEVLIVPFLLFTVKSCIKIDGKWKIELVSLVAGLFSLEESENSANSTLVNTHVRESSDDSSATSVNSFEI